MKKILFIASAILFILGLVLYKTEFFSETKECQKCNECISKYPGEGVLNLIDKGCYNVDECSKCH